MVTIRKIIEQQIPIKYLNAICHVRYWEGAKINGIYAEEDGSNIPCKDKANWDVLIDIDTGQIKNWPKGTTAEIHFKVCDAGCYKLLDENLKIVKEIDGYVPSIMCPEGDGYGDYVIMNISSNGIIEKWDNSDLSEFEDEQ